MENKNLPSPTTSKHLLTLEGRKDLILNLLANGDYAAISANVPKTVRECVLVGVPMMPMRMDEQFVELIQDELVVLAAQLNINPALNLKPHQLPVIAESIFENFKRESIEDIILCFRRGGAGFYGQVFRLDGAVITDWMTKYLEEKYTIVESTHNKNKEEQKLEDVSYDAYKIRRQAELERSEEQRQHEFQKRQVEAKKELEFMQQKAGYKAPNAEQLAERELKMQWIRENTDPYTGKVLDGHPSFDEWKMKQ